MGDGLGLVSPFLAADDREVEGTLAAHGLAIDHDGHFAVDVPAYAVRAEPLGVSSMGLLGDSDGEGLGGSGELRAGHGELLWGGASREVRVFRRRRDFPAPLEKSSVREI